MIIIGYHNSQLSTPNSQLNKLYFTHSFCVASVLPLVMRTI